MNYLLTCPYMWRVSEGTKGHLPSQRFSGNVVVWKHYASLLLKDLINIAQQSFFIILPTQKSIAFTQSHVDIFCLHDCFSIPLLIHNMMANANGDGLKNCSLGGFLGNQKWFFYGITVNPPLPFGTLLKTKVPKAGFDVIEELFCAPQRIFQ